MIGTYPLFCNPVDHFAQTFRSLWSLFLQSNDTSHLLFVMLWKNPRSWLQDKRCRGRELIKAHLASSPPNFYLQVIATEIGRKSTSRHNSQIRISGLWPQRIHITSSNVRVVQRDSRSTAFTTFDSTKKRWAINHGWLQHTQIQTTISGKYSLGHTEQIQSSTANKSESRTDTNLSCDSADMMFLGKYVEWFWFWWERASSQLCHRPQCLLLPWTGKVWKMMICQKISFASRAAGHMFASDHRPHHNHLVVQTSLSDIFVRYTSDICHRIVRKYLLHHDQISLKYIQPLATLRPSQIQISFRQSLVFAKRQICHHVQQHLAQTCKSVILNKES